MVEYPLDRGADINGRPGYTDRSAAAIAGSTDTRRELMVSWLGERGA